MTKGQDKERGVQLLNAVERIIDGDELLIERVEHARTERPQKPRESEEAWLNAVAGQLIRAHATKAAIAGGASALPGIVPGIGSLVAVLGGTLADIGYTLKYEVEMALCLAHHYGFDIREPKERQLAFLLASVSTYGAKTNKNAIFDILKIEREALWKYTPRQLSKMLISIFTKIVLHSSSKGLAKLVPFVGIAVSASVNKVLTQRVGEGVAVELASRWRINRQEAEEEIIDAEIVDEAQEDKTPEAAKEEQNPNEGSAEESP